VECEKKRAQECVDCELRYEECQCCHVSCFRLNAKEFIGSLIKLQCNFCYYFCICNICCRLEVSHFNLLYIWYDSLDVGATLSVFVCTRQHRKRIDSHAPSGVKIRDPVGFVICTLSHINFIRVTRSRKMSWAGI
jgi:hypothetical protein